ncbi:hypothetical protein, partial [Peribacillus simplex]|uniref:hypothetical protein n=1 Tax=Peribacillus simplex TaxID=1478 RepID=UPI001C88B32D
MHSTWCETKVCILIARRFVVEYFGRCISLQALPFRGRSLSLLGFQPAVSHVDAYIPQECRCLPLHSTWCETKVCILIARRVVVEYFGRCISLQALPFRGRSLSLLGFQPAVSHVDAHIPQECRCLPLHSTWCETKVCILIARRVVVEYFG